MKAANDRPVRDRVRRIATFESLMSCLPSRSRLWEMGGYLQVSIAAAILDFGIFTLLMFSGLVAGTIGGSVSYLIALTFHYQLASRTVFCPELTGKSRRQLAAEYLATGLVGAAMTAVVMHILIAYVGLWPYAAKIAGVGASFFTVYALRSFIVFKARPDKVGESAAVGRSERDLVQSTS